MTQRRRSPLRLRLLTLAAFAGLTGCITPSYVFDPANAPTPAYAYLAAGDSGIDEATYWIEAVRSEVGPRIDRSMFGPADATIGIKIAANQRYTVTWRTRPWLKGAHFRDEVANSFLAEPGKCYSAAGFTLKNAPRNWLPIEGRDVNRGVNWGVGVPRMIEVKPGEELWPHCEKAAAI